MNSFLRFVFLCNEDRNHAEKETILIKYKGMVVIFSSNVFQMPMT